MPILLASSISFLKKHQAILATWIISIGLIPTGLSYLPDLNPFLLPQTIALRPEAIIKWIWILLVLFVALLITVVILVKDLKEAYSYERLLKELKK